MSKHGDECVDELCSMCRDPATHKIEESTRCQDEGVVGRHPFTNYVCCDHFGALMGVAALNWCRIDQLRHTPATEPWTVDDARRAVNALRYGLDMPPSLKDLALDRVRQALDRLEAYENDVKDTPVAGEDRDLEEADRDRPTDRTEPRRPPSPAPGTPNIHDLIERFNRNLDVFEAKVRAVRNLMTHALGEDPERDEEVRRGWGG